MGVIGNPDDLVELTVNAETFKIWESYEIKTSVLTQPASFVLKCGSAQTLGIILDTCKPGAKFQLRIGGELLHTGFLSRPHIRSSSNGVEVTVRGRDCLAPLHDAYVTADRTVEATTPLAFIEGLLKDVGLGGVAIHTRPGSRAHKPFTKAKNVKAGGRSYEFARKVLDPIGIFLWCLPDGTFALDEPDTTQEVSSEIVRTGLDELDQVRLVQEHDDDDDTDKRYARYLVHGKGGIPVSGTGTCLGSWIDEEMVNFGPPLSHKSRVIKDTSCKSQEEAEKKARRVAAEINRGACKLQYGVVGHKIPKPGSAERRLARVNTMTSVDDRVGKVKAKRFIESCTYKAGATGTQTTLALMRPNHMIFASDFEEG